MLAVAAMINSFQYFYKQVKYIIESIIGIFTLYFLSFHKNQVNHIYNSHHKMLYILRFLSIKLKLYSIKFIYIYLDYLYSRTLHDRPQFIWFPRLADIKAPLADNKALLADYKSLLMCLGIHSSKQQCTAQMSQQPLDKWLKLLFS